MTTRYIFVGGSRNAEILTDEGELLTNVDSGIEDDQLDAPPIELSVEGGGQPQGLAPHHRAAVCQVVGAEKSSMNV